MNPTYYGMEAKYAHLQRDPKINPFIDPEGYKAYVAERAKTFQETSRKQPPNWGKGCPSSLEATSEELQ